MTPGIDSKLRPPDPSDACRLFRQATTGARSRLPLAGRDTAKWAGFSRRAHCALALNLCRPTPARLHRPAHANQQIASSHGIRWTKKVARPRGEADAAWVKARSGEIRPAIATMLALAHA
jgi:hypothetical protein